MPANREVQQKRRRTIREILLEEPPVAEQREIVERLKERGISATQSSVSRDLKDLGAIRVKGRYAIPSWAEEYESPFRRVIPFIRKVTTAGPHQTLLITDAGAAPVVAQAIDAAKWEDIVGTLAGHNSVLVLTENFIFQKLLYDRLKYYLQEEVEEEEDDEE